MRDLMLKHNGILGLMSCNKTAQIIAKTSTSLQLSVSNMLTGVNFPIYFRYRGLIQHWTLLFDADGCVCTTGRTTVCEV